MRATLQSKRENTKSKFDAYVIQRPSPARNMGFGPKDERAMHNGIGSSKARKLTPREVEVLEWVARGKSSFETAAVLGISKRTVEEHIERVVLKLAAANRVNAVALAIRDGLIKI